MSNAATNKADGTKENPRQNVIALNLDDDVMALVKSEQQRILQTQGYHVALAQIVQALIRRGIAASRKPQ